MLDTSSSFAGLIRSNKTAAFIVECLKEDTTEKKIVEAMFEKYDAPTIPKLKLCRNFLSNSR